ncbi:glutamate-cysteine ligase family protein [Dictyobacter kobayashii]|uniref:glutamate--cysteine ligase n=1 Tax=Dictyobacter kobayashii TaxID=2014872 RepID=A0A402AVE4_9CHLR|nr:glutamate-cysteine ligase family protein [Dictyobacter kobayashii]GCE23082.1 hypothetical protein KDK_68820 [Dictyobacter kobayashii]
MLEQAKKDTATGAITTHATQAYTQTMDMRDAQRYFTAGFRDDINQPAAGPRWVGLENEYPLVFADGSIISRDVIDFLWQELVAQGWEPLKDEATQKIVAVKKQRPDVGGERKHHYDIITSDLGYAILEVDLAPAPSIIIAEQHLRRLMQTITTILAQKNASILGYGVQPKAQPDVAYLGEKSRYEFMVDICKQENVINPMGYGVELHTLDASCQTQVEISAAEAIPVVNALNATAGLRLALLANSPIWQGQNDDKCKSIRQEFLDWCWPARKQQLGLPPRFQNIEHYLDYIFGFRPIAVTRDGEMYRINHQGTFRQFFLNAHSQTGFALDGTSQALQSTLSDITTQCGFAWFFSRLQPAYGTIEDRISCQQPPHANLCASALTLGLVENYQALVGLAETISLDQWRDIHKLASIHGLNFTYPGVDIDRYIAWLLAIATRGLQKRAFGEEKYLEPLYQRAETRRCPADDVRAQFEQGAFEQIVRSNDMRNWLKG